MWNEAGIDVYALEDWKLKNGTIVGFPGAEAWDRSNGAMIEQKCDILGACAKEKVITAENAPRIQVIMLWASYFVFQIPKIIKNNLSVTK